MTYAGLTISDKPALDKAKRDGLTMCWIMSVGKPVNIDLALAQIAEMESAEKPATEITVSGKPMTWNDRINQMTVEEKAKYFVAVKWSGGGSVYISIDNSIHERRKQAENRNKKILNSPYTEGETK